MIVEEGPVHIQLPGEPFQKGPGTKTVGFYNASQRINRDLTLSFLASRKPSNFLDAFGGSGIRGIRVNRELGIRTVISELNPISFEIARKNAELNGADIEVFNESFKRTLGRYLFDFIDIDPYGSIIPYIDDALMNVRNKGYVGATATDLSSLTGSVPTKTKRRYGALIKTDMFKHEMGIRLLIAYVVKRGAAFDMGITPELSFWHSHFYRVIFRVERGASKADSSLHKVDTVNKSTFLWEKYEDLVEGPVWTGQLSNDKALRSMLETPLPSLSQKSRKYLEVLSSEDLSQLYIELTDVARQMSSNMPPLTSVMDLLADSGISTSRTHYSSTGLKTNGPLPETYDSVAHFMSENYR